jgi:hypothetical protein
VVDFQKQIDSLFFGGYKRQMIPIQSERLEEILNSSVAVVLNSNIKNYISPETMIITTDGAGRMHFHSESSWGGFDVSIKIDNNHSAVSVHALTAAKGHQQL